jgi:hypothetical protein
MTQGITDGFAPDEEQVGEESVGEHIDSEFQQLGVVYIDRRGCLRCTHVVGELGKKTYKCTYENGNTNCPAARFQIIIGMDIEQAMTDVIESIQKSDIESVLQILSDVKGKDPAVVQDFMREFCGQLGVELEEEPVDEEAEDLEGGESETEDDDEIDNDGEEDDDEVSEVADEDGDIEDEVEDDED